MSTIPAWLDRPNVLTISDLTSQIRDRLEEDFRDVWVVGELSSYRAPSSGHLYFTLKDEESQVKAVMFRSYAGLLRFRPEDGLEVIVRGRVSVYPARGDLQLYTTIMEPRGVGAQQLALEQLKALLATEGLFAAERKRPLPFFPRCIGIVTALRGAAIQDILTILYQRCPYTRVIVRPTKVQGVGAGIEVAASIRDLNEHGEADVIIVGRGGGSREDLSAFNEEVVARAIAASAIPVVAAVGHEIDLSIADLVADRRAPTPTAAAEMVVPQWEELRAHVEERYQSLFTAIVRQLLQHQDAVANLQKRLRDPRQMIAVNREYLRATIARLTTAFVRRHEQGRSQWQKLATALNSLSPLAVLGRGYSLTRMIPSGKVIADATTLIPGDSVRLTFARGEARATIDEVSG
jgi:exodeoxyribonuclease VII large subunit